MKAYVGSSYADLRPFREAAFDQLRLMGVESVGMEYFTATAAAPVETCLDQVRAADIYVLILGHRYGFIPQGYDRSLTHLEYEQALANGKPILAFVLSDDAPVPLSGIERDNQRQAQLDEFKNQIFRQRQALRIHSPDSLKAALSAALFDLLNAPTRIEPQQSVAARLKACREENERYQRVIDDLTAKLQRVVPADPIWRGRDFRSDGLLCFSLLPFQENFFEVYESSVAPAAQDLGLRSLHAGEIFGTREVVEDIWDSICAARVIVVDVTGRNPNVFYELGICHTLGKECVVITQSKDDVPFDIRHRRFIEYRPDRLTLLRTTLRKTMQKVLSTGLPPEAEGTAGADDA